jgi:hypothetical protein
MSHPPKSHNHGQTDVLARHGLKERGPCYGAYKTSLHGQGAVPVVVPEHLARFAINSVAANITFMVEAHRQKGASA